MNIRYVSGLEEIAPLLSLKLTAVERSGETRVAFKPGEPPPDLIHAPGEGGQEPRLYVLGPDPQTVVEKVVALKNALSVAGKLQ
jgi:predicted fused transcriptional regulator/phosphomethylpyrimidine kinase